MKKIQSIYRVMGRSFALILISCLSCSCVSSHGLYRLEEDVPYQIIAGVYEDIEGNIHYEKTPRWSSSETDLFRSKEEARVYKKAKKGQDKPTVYDKVSILLKDYSWFIVLCIILIVYLKTRLKKEK